MTTPRPPGADRSANLKGRRQRNQFGEADATIQTAVDANVYAALHAEWAAIANRPDTRRACQAWGHRCPELVPFASPGDLVATIGRLGDPIRSCALLSELLVLAADDTLAARAVLQAVLPGLRRTAGHRWRRAQPCGPWRSERDAADDALSVGWEAIMAWAGHRQPRPAALIVRSAEGRLRRIYRSWDSEVSRTTAIIDGGPDPQPFGYMAGSPESDATALIAEAHAANVLDHREASILFACGVIGDPVSRAAKTIGLEGSVAHRVLAQSREALRAWLAGDDDEIPFQRIHDISCRPLADRTPALFADRNPLEDHSMTPLLLTPDQAICPAWHQSLQAVCPPGCRRDRVGHHRRQSSHSLPRPHTLRRGAPGPRRPSLKRGGPCFGSWWPQPGEITEAGSGAVRRMLDESSNLF